jgi:sulfite exporter TauE/SafE
MLGSITPLGERGRGSRWEATVAIFTVASAVAGAILGGLMGAVGASAARMLGRSDSGGLVVLGALILIGTALDAGVPRALPSLRRQVNEDWLRRYRRWVYALGFGFQLGLGVVTIVSASAVYLVFAAALLSGSPLLGAVIGGAFGLMRAMPLLATARVRLPRQLAGLDGVLRRWDGPVRKVAVGSEAALAALAFAAGLVAASA